jgi:hypothetical protein
MKCPACDKEVKVLPDKPELVWNTQITSTGGFFAGQSQNAIPTSEVYKCCNEKCARCGEDSDTSCRVTTLWEERETRFNEFLCMECWDHLSLWLYGKVYGDESTNYESKTDPTIRRNYK